MNETDEHWRNSIHLAEIYNKLDILEPRKSEDEHFAEAMSILEAKKMNKTDEERIAELCTYCFQNQMAANGDYARKIRDAQSALVKAYKDTGVDIKFEIEACYDFDHMSVHWVLNIDDTSGNELMVMISRNAEEAFKSARYIFQHKNMGEVKPGDDCKCGSKIGKDGYCRDCDPRRLDNLWRIQHNDQLARKIQIRPIVR